MSRSPKCCSSSPQSVWARWGSDSYSTLTLFTYATDPKYIQLGDKETAAAVQAAILALRFFADQPPTAAHISYEFRDAIPGVTYLDLAAQHVRHWAAIKSVAA